VTFSLCASYASRPDGFSSYPLSIFISTTNTKKKKPKHCVLVSDSYNSDTFCLSLRCSYDILLGSSRCSLLIDDYTAYLILASFVCFLMGV